MNDLRTQYHKLLIKKATTNALFFSQDEEIYRLRKILSGQQLEISYRHGS